MNLSGLDLKGRSLLKLADLSDRQLSGLVDLACKLKERKRRGEHLHSPLLRGRHICLIFQKSSTRTHCATVVAIRDEGGDAEYLGQQDIHFGKKESVPDSARVLGRMFDGILFRGFSQRVVEELAQYSGVPVWNGLTDEWHPTQILADLQTVQEYFGTLAGLTLAFVGDGRNNVCNSLMVGCAKVGMNMINICPPELSPDPAVLALARQAAERNRCSIQVCHDPIEGVRGAHVLYTDVWVSMGEESLFQQRRELLQPFQIDLAMVRRTGNLESNRVIFLHCLPAFHDHNTEITREIGALEVSNEVFEAPFSKVFVEAENRMHTIKAMIIASLA